MIDPMTDDEWSDYVANGQAFAVQALQAAAVGMIPHVQLRNPAGSAVRVRLRYAEPMAFFGGFINTNFRRHDPALAALNAFGITENLLGGGAVNVAEVRIDSLVALVGAPFWLILAVGRTRQDYPPQPLDYGHDLLPGQGFAQSGIPGGLLITGLQWAEVPL